MDKVAKGMSQASPRPAWRPAPREGLMTRMTCALRGMASSVMSLVRGRHVTTR